MVINEEEEIEKKKYDKFVNVFYLVLFYGFFIAVTFIICASISSKQDVYRWKVIRGQTPSNGLNNLIVEFETGKNCYDLAAANPDCFCAVRVYSSPYSSVCKLYDNECENLFLDETNFVTTYEKVLYLEDIRAYPNANFFS